MARPVSIPDTFEGPLDLLLYLVRRDEIDIHNIPIAHLTSEYLKEMARLSDLDVDTASEFMAMAAMLIEIKSRMLLPAPPAVEGEEDEPLLDPREGLVKALLEYRRFKEAASLLAAQAERQALRFARVAPDLAAEEEDGNEEESAFEPGNVYDLLRAFRAMIVSLQAQEIVSDEVPTEVRMAQIMEAVAAAGRTTFRRLLSDEPTRGEMVGFFIALLELVRLRQVWARQADDFSDIHIERRPPPGEMPASASAKALAPNKGKRRAFASLFPPIVPRRCTISRAVPAPRFAIAFAIRPLALARGRRPAAPWP
ncbi:MAG: segregation/condensation protein A [Planctomycetota bacterium]|nr:segregation/condensation protein A [Planctomycetota bacterium]